jgi:hypothetical protein
MPAALLVVLGEAWLFLFLSLPLLAYAGAMAVCFHLFVTGYEDRRCNGSLVQKWSSWPSLVR